MRQTSTPKRFLALTLSAGILTTGLALSSTTATAAEPTAVTASAPQARSTDDAAPTGWFDRLKRNFRQAGRGYQDADQRAARNFR